MCRAEPLLQEIDRRLRALFERLAAGDDAPPSQRLRLEGLLEAAQVLGTPAPALQARVEELHREVFGEPIAAAPGDDWRAAYPFPEIPVFMQRAPVAPSTGD